MWLLLRLAWRNVLRNKRRTLLCGIAVGMGLASLIFLSALFEGMLQSMIRTATDTFLGHAQVHAKGFRDTMEVERTITNSPAVLAALRAEPEVEAAAPRAVSFAMVSSAANMSSVVLYGIEPDSEKTISMLDEAIVEGKYLEGTDSPYVLLGSKLAETLEVRLGDRVVVTVAQAGTGELSQELFRVGGVFRFRMREADSGLAYVGLKRATAMLGTQDSFHEVGLRFHDMSRAGDKANPLWARYSVGGNEALGWRALLPQLDSMIDLSWVAAVIRTTLVFAIVALTIMNTLFMSLYERIYEFGILRALGTRPSLLGSIIMAEAASLALISIALGLALGLGLNAYFSVHGIDYSGIDYAGVTFTEPIRTIFLLEQVTLMPALVFVFSLVAALYPALYAARLVPARALRRSL